MKKLLAVFGCLAACAVNVGAITINVTDSGFNTAWPLAAYGVNPAGVNRWETDVGGTANYDAADIKLVTGYSGTLTELYKQNAGGSEEGSLASSYATTFANSVQDFLLTYTGGSIASGSPIFLYVKDGNHTPIHYVFDITGWNGTDSINGLNFWTQQGSISHVSLFGTGTSAVPDGGFTASLLGLGILGMSFLRRR